jgi:ketose-bisphosphate aldolase
MPLRPIPELIAHAEQNGYALGYFESWNLESLQGVLDAAEATRSPILLGFNGEFLSRPGRKLPERLRCYAAMGKAAVDSASVPCALVFNECSRDNWTRDAILAGFNLVMPADPAAPFQEFIGRVKALADFAHQRRVAIESELGELPFGGSGKVTGGSDLTDPEMAARFVQETGIDLIAVSVGNVHVLVEGQRDLDLDQLCRIRVLVRKPLVLHGGTGISSGSLQEAIRMGVAKVNYGTYLKQAYLRAIRLIPIENSDPHELLGLGSEHDVMMAGRIAVRDAVLERIGLLGCCGKAD